MRIHLSDENARKWLAAILLLALGLRLAFLAFFGHTLSLQASGYDVYAVNLINGNGYTRFADLHPDSDLPPLYSFFLAAVYLTLGRSPLPVALIQIGVDLVTIALVYLIGRRAFPGSGPGPALLAAFFTAVYPYMLFQNLSVNDTALFTMLLAAVVWGAYRARDGAAAPDGRPAALWRAVRWPIFIGLVSGAAALTKTLILVLLPLLALWWWRWLGLRRAAVMTVAAGLALALVIAPWVVRNTILHGELVLISTNDGSNLYQGNNPCVADYLASGWDAQWVNCLERLPAGLKETDEARWYREQAVRWLVDNPGQWPRLFLQKLATLWNPQITPYEVPPRAMTTDTAFVDEAVYLYETPAFQAARAIHLLYFGPLLLLGLAGLALAVKNRPPAGPLLAAMAAVTLAYLIYHPSTRYRMPVDPLLFLFSGYALSCAAEIWRRRH